MFSYYGIAIGLVLSLSNYLMLGWGYEVDGFYLKSFEIWLACVVVFPCAGNLGYILLEYRLGHSSLLTSAWETLKWIPFLYVLRLSIIPNIFSSVFDSFFFFGGLSIHLSQALLAHMFSYNITWGATKKEVERSNFWLEVPKIIKRFWMALIICIVIAAGMVILSTDLIPLGWRIPGTDWAVIVPLAYVFFQNIILAISLTFVAVLLSVPMHCGR